MAKGLFGDKLVVLLAVLGSLLIGMVAGWGPGIINNLTAGPSPDLRPPASPVTATPAPTAPLPTATEPAPPTATDVPPPPSATATRIPATATATVRSTTRGSPTPRPTAGPTLDGSTLVRVNLRTAPDVTATIIQTLAPDTPLVVTGRTVPLNWYRVQVEGLEGEGWITSALDVVVVEGSIETLPAVTPLP